MRIGELSQRTGVSTRMLRYYEECGLVWPQREANGYRSYPPDTVELVGLITSMLAFNCPTAAIRRRVEDLGWVG